MEDIIIIDSAIANPSNFGSFTLPLPYPLTNNMKSVELLSATIPFVSAMNNLYYLIIDIGNARVRNNTGGSGSFYIPINNATTNGTICYISEENPQKVGPLPYVSQIVVMLKDPTSGSIVNPGSNWKMVLRINS